MNLVDALAAVAPAVGDGKLIPQHAYVFWDGTLLHATDGRQWVQVQADGNWHADRFCVRYDALKRALARDGLRSILSDGQYGLKLSYGRGRASLKGIDITSYPIRRTDVAATIISLPEHFTHRVKDLMSFCANGDGHVWQQAVHLTPDFMFAANSYALAKCQIDCVTGLTLGIPTWACNFISEQDSTPTHLRYRTNIISFVWANGIELFTSLLTEQAPASILTLATGLVEPTTPVPDEFKETIDRLKTYGAKTCRVGDGAVVHSTDELHLEDDVEIRGAVRTWGVDSLSSALEHATTLDLSGQHGVWQGSGYVGVFSGRSD